jgi:acetyl-CoA carboxylase biotin carboxyl carrier protein
MSADVHGAPGGAPGEHEPPRGQIVDLDFVRGLIAAVDDSGIDSLEISRGGTRIRIAKTPPAAAVPTGGNHAAHGPAPAAQPLQDRGEQTAPHEAATAPVAPPSNLIEVTSPMVGTFYRAPAPEAPSYVELGSRVVKGQTLCILEAMKLMNELESEVQGIVREICVENAEPVEYGQVLFRLEPES